MRCFLITVAVLMLAGCGSAASRGERTPTREPSDRAIVVAAAGDIACPSTDVEFRTGRGIPSACQQHATAKVVETIDPNAVLVLGDSQYDSATPAEYARSYAVSWGRFLDITRAAIGNHEYADDPSARGYFSYFGAAAGPRGRGYYSFDLGDWHLIALNSNCAHVGGCARGSKQERWLRNDLRSNTTRCTLAFFHHPMFSSSKHGNSSFVRDLWATLHRYRADVVLSGHDHVYERFAPLDAHGNPRPAGIRQFVVGTGGKEHYDITRPRAHSVAHDDHTFGVLKLILEPRGYAWEFAPIAGETYTDRGHAKCV